MRNVERTKKANMTKIGFAVLLVIALLTPCAIHASATIADVQAQQASTVTKQGAQIKKPQIGKWKKTYDSGEDKNATGDVVSYTIKWKKVKGASGYQVEFTSREPGNKRSPERTFQKKCSYQENFSGIPQSLKIKVRAYKNVNGEKVFGAWSKVRKVKHNWF